MFIPNIIAFLIPALHQSFSSTIYIQRCSSFILQLLLLHNKHHSQQLNLKMFRPRLDSNCQPWGYEPCMLPLRHSTSSYKTMKNNPIYCICLLDLKRICSTIPNFGFEMQKIGDSKTKLLEVFIKFLEQLSKRLVSHLSYHWIF